MERWLVPTSPRSLSKDEVVCRNSKRQDETRMKQRLRLNGKRRCIRVSAHPCICVYQRHCEQKDGKRQESASSPAGACRAVCLYTYRSTAKCKALLHNKPWRRRHHLLDDDDRVLAVDCSIGVIELRPPCDWLAGRHNWSH